MKILVTPLDDVGNKKFTVTHILSVLVHNKPILVPEGVVHKLIAFDDLEEADRVSFARLKQEQPRRTDLDKYIFPDRDHVQEALEFGRSVAEEGFLQIHCHAGISRSTAIAFAIWCDRLGRSKEAEAFEKTKESAIYGTIWPNNLIVQLADSILGRNGQMVEIVVAYKDKVKNKSKLLLP